MHPENGLDTTIELHMANAIDVTHPHILKTSLNQFYDSITDTTIPHSYFGYDKSLQIGFTELHGLREAQEDRIAFGTLPEFATFTEHQRNQFLTNKISQLQIQLDEANMQHVGSTLCAVIYFDSQIYCVNVGDSTAFLAKINSTGKIQQFQRLNKNLHNPSERHEMLRLKNTGKKQHVHHKRLAGLLLSRSMGDNALEEFGLIHTPEIDSYTMTQTQDEKILLIVACDGLTESKFNLEKVLEKNWRLPPEKIALSLAESALDAGSGDNISVLVAVLNPEQHTPTYMAVFDGHGGIAAADLLRKNFHRNFVTG